MTPEQMAFTDELPTIGETVDHAGKTYEVTEIGWDREEDVIEVTYRRKYHEEGKILPDAFGPRMLGVVPTYEIRDEAHVWRHEP